MGKGRGGETPEALLPRLRRVLEDRFALLFVDLDGFSAINESFGHGVGDRVIIDLGHSLGC